MIVYVVWGDNPYSYDLNEDILEIYTSHELAEGAIQESVNRHHVANVRIRKENKEEQKELSKDDMDWYEEEPDVHNDPLWEDWEIDDAAYFTRNYRIEEFGLDEEA